MPLMFTGLAMLPVPLSVAPLLIVSNAVLAMLPSTSSSPLLIVVVPV